MDNFDLSLLPFEVRSKLVELELELSDGDITEKGYQKKKIKLLGPYFSSFEYQNSPAVRAPPLGGVQLPGLVGPAIINPAPQTHMCSLESSGDDVVVTAQDLQHVTESVHDEVTPVISQNGRHIREDIRYRSDLREEAVREALSRNPRQLPDALLPNRRRENGRPSSTHQYHRHTDLATDDSEDDPSSGSSAPVVSDRCENDSNNVAAPVSNFMRPTFGSPNQSTPSQSYCPDNGPSLTVELKRNGSGPSFALSDRSGIHTSDSFEELAAQAAAQLNFNTPTNPGFLVPLMDSELSHASPMPSHNYNIPATTSIPPFGGINVFPSAMLTKNLASQSSPVPTPWVMAQNQPRPSEPLICDNTADITTGLALPRGSLDVTCATDTRELTVDNHLQPNIGGGMVVHNRVSEKIQQLVNTLKRPKRRPLPEYFLDEDDQVLVRPVIDPSAPQPQGPPSHPLAGDELVVPSGLPRNLESALQRYAGLSCKTPALTCLDVGGRPTQVLTYAKLLNRSIRIAYMLLNKLGHRGEQSLKPRDRVALVYANSEPISFLAAFYGCILASVVPIAIEVPSTRRDAACQSMGFLLSSLDARVVLASEQCYKALQRSNTGISASGGSGDIGSYAGWPRVTWINTDHHGGGSKPPKDWVPPDRLANEESLYMEYTFSKDGSVHAVMVSRRAALAHSRALTASCHYSEEDVVVCVVDSRREIGLWHAVLTSIFNGLHVIFVPYSVMQVEPGSWLRMVTKYRASVAIVKSRDMHWALLAERDHPNVNLSSLRMLLVADGSNPWSLNSCDSFVQKFRSRGFRPEAVCPAAGSPETLTLCLRRPVAHHLANTVNGKVFSNGLHTTSSTNDVNAASGAVRGVISIHSLTHGVVRMDSEESLTSLMLQDCGQILPGASAVVVRFGVRPVLCRTDELGEICLAADYTGTGYWGLRGQTGTHFHVEPVNEDNTPAHAPGSITYTRSGFLGFTGPASSGSPIFICGSINGLMTVAGRRHNSDDVIATVLAVQPTKIVYRGRIAVFSTEILKDERIVIIAELRQGFSDEAAFTWMSLVLQAVDSIHQVSVYCLAMVLQNTLPRTPFGGINCHLVKRLFSEGQLHPTALLLCPHSAIQNLPQPRQTRPSLVGPSAIMCGQVVQGARMAEARGRAIQSVNPTVGQTGGPETRLQLIHEILIWRATQTPESRLFTVYNQKGQEASSLTCAQLLKRAERIGCQLQDKMKLSSGNASVVALLYPPGTELVCAFYACLLIGLIPVPIRPPRLDQSPSGITVNSSPMSSTSSPGSSLHLSGPVGSGSTTALSLLGLGGGGSGSSQLSGSTGGSWTNVHFRPAAPSFEASLELVWNVVKHSNASAILTQQSIVKLLKSKEASSRIPYNQWPLVVDSEENFRKKITPHHQNPCTDQPVAYLDFAAATTGTLTGIRVTHQVVNALCLAQKVQCEFYPTREVVLSLDPYSGLGFTLWALTSVHCGHHSILVPPSVTETVPDLWLSVCSQRKELTTRHMLKNISLLKQQPQSPYLRDLSLASLRSLVIVTEERPRVQLTAMFIKLFSSHGLMSRAVSTSFGCRVNLTISLQGASSPEGTTVYVDRISLRNDRIKLLEKGSPHSLCLMESGKLLPGLQVAIANPDLLGQCADSQLGEIWVASPHNSTALLGPFDHATIGRRPSGSSASTTVDSSETTTTAASDALYTRLVTGDTERLYARTGYLGFVRRTDLTQSDGELHDAIFIVGSLEEAIMLRGMRFHPVDIETTVMRSQKKICECAVFTWSNLLVVVAELMGEESEAMDLVHPITAQVLNEHQLIVGVVVVTDPGTVPVNSCGEKQRILLRDMFVNDKLDPIYVSYNM